MTHRQWRLPGQVKTALERIEDQNTIEMDSDKKAAMEKWAADEFCFAIFESS